MRRIPRQLAPDTHLWGAPKAGRGGLPQRGGGGVFLFGNPLGSNLSLDSGLSAPPRGKTYFSPDPLSSCAFIPAAKLSGNSAHGLIKR